jgi:hypothetical protein
MATTGQSKTSTSTPTAAFDLPSVEEATQRIRDLNERLIESSKSAGLVALDAYEKALQSLVDFEQKVASASQLDWVSALATTHAKFIADVTTSYTKAARDLLK